MKKLSAFLYTTVLVFGVVGMANATLIDRGGGLIYDTDLDITWLQDANYAQTMGYDNALYGFDTKGEMFWDDGMAWVDGLEYYDSIRDVTLTDWRLPMALPVNGTNYDFNFSYDGSSDRGYNITTLDNEMAYLFYVELGNRGRFDTDGNGPHAAGTNSGLFINIDFNRNIYFTANEYILDSDYALDFNFCDGEQGYNHKYSYRYIWPVMDGDVAPAPVPEPSTMLLFCAGLLGSVGFSKKFRKFSQQV